MYVISLAGQFRSGKDSASDYLCDKLNNMAFCKWKRGSLGKKVKEIFAEHFGVTMEFIEEWKVKKEPPPGFTGPLRDGLTKIGDGWRDTKPDIWIKKLFEGNTDNLVISDCRYINESQACRGESDLPYMKDRKGITILLWRPGFENDKPSRSEQELMPFVRQLKEKPSGIIDNPEIPFDLWIRNNGTKEQLFDKLDNLVIPYFLKKFDIASTLENGSNYFIHCRE